MSDYMICLNDYFLFCLSLPYILLCFRAVLAIHQIYLETWSFQPNALTRYHLLQIITQRLNLASSDSTLGALVILFYKSAIGAGW